MYSDSYDVQVLEAEEWRDKKPGFSTLDLAKDWVKKNLPPELRARILCEHGAIYERAHNHLDQVRWLRRV